MKDSEAIGLRLIATHVRHVQTHMSHVLSILTGRLVAHDGSKYGDSELDLVLGKAKLDSLEYNSTEYKEGLAEVKKAVDHHWKHNSHHPEYFENGIKDMNLFDLIEMLCDWKAACETSNGDIESSIKSNTERFALSPEMVHLLRNTAFAMKWV